MRTIIHSMLSKDSNNFVAFATIDKSVRLSDIFNSVSASAIISDNCLYFNPNSIYKNACGIYINIRENNTGVFAPSPTVLIGDPDSNPDFNSCLTILDRVLDAFRLSDSDQNKVRRSPYYSAGELSRRLNYMVSQFEDRVNSYKNDTDFIRLRKANHGDVLRTIVNGKYTIFMHDVMVDCVDFPNDVINDFEKKVTDIKYKNRLIENVLGIERIIS